MSFFTFIASDFGLEEVKNPYIKIFSVNEALKKGIYVHKFVLNNKNFDRDKPGVILWIEDEKYWGEIEIRHTEKVSWLPTSLEYCSTLEWVYSEKRAEHLISYIQSHLKTSSVIEIWHVWCGADIPIDFKGHHIHIEDLLPADLKKLFEACEFDSYNNLVITR